MKTITLTNGGVALVDEEDFDRLSRHRWQLNGGRYASRRKYVGRYLINRRPYYRTIYMHREILGDQEIVGGEVDHINRNKLDNRKMNLRIVSRAMNVLNQPPRRNNTSGTTGVSWFTPANLWRAYIKAGRGTRIELGYFRTKEAAIAARIEAEQRYYPGL